jgi:hypothetical protein
MRTEDWNAILQKKLQHVETMAVIDTDIDTDESRETTLLIMAAVGGT